MNGLAYSTTLAKSRKEMTREFFKIPWPEGLGMSFYTYCALRCHSVFEIIQPSNMAIWYSNPVCEDFITYAA